MISENKFIEAYLVPERYIQLWTRLLPNVRVMSIYGQGVWNLYPECGMIEVPWKILEDYIHSTASLPVDCLI